MPMKRDIILQLNLSANTLLCPLRTIEPHLLDLAVLPTSFFRECCQFGSKEVERAHRLQGGG